MIGIIISFCVGVFFGAFIMSACAAAGQADRENEKLEFERSLHNVNSDQN